MAYRYQSFKVFSTRDNLQLDGLACIPDKIVGVIQIAHGMSEVKERYKLFMAYMADKGYLCVIHDHRGHGESVKSDDDMGYFYDGGYEIMVEDIHSVMGMVKARISPELPYILMGHSMGALASRVFMKKYDFMVDMLILLGNPSKPFMTEIGIHLAKTMGKLKGPKAHSKLLDNITINSPYESKFKDEGIRFAWMTSDLEVVKEFNAHPKCGFTFTISGYEQLARLTKEAYSKEGWQLRNPEVPILIASGKEDPCHLGPRNFGKSVHHLKDVGYENIQARLYGKMRHELLNEKDKTRVYKDIYKFISDNV
ncbi:MAG: alpha/beta fold hydrolase [Lachnospiraceae bacterium]|nr:alpha/beta fold hydrolase [Lachnospiraceae bacterium]